MDRWEHVSRLYHAVRNRAEDERAAFLSQECQGDDALRRDVESLLRRDNDTECVSTRPALEIAAKLRPEIEQRSIVGRRFGPYEILSALGAGGMGEVYKAHDTRLKRPVAVKILTAAFSLDHDRRARFFREAQAIAALNHPHICTIHDVGHEDGLDYLVMEYLEGETLRERVAQGPLALDHARTIAIDVCEALSQAHKRGVVHRDVKPGNIMLATNGTKLLDFGLAKVARDDDLKSSDFETATGVVLGTAAYMSPEQLLGLAIDARNDVFSFGVVLYEMVTGARPFRGTNVVDTVDAILHKQPEPITRGVPRELQQVIFRCLEKERHQRYVSAQELLWALEALSASTAGSTVPRQRPRSERLPPNNLPKDRTHFIGRETELDECGRLLGETRLLTITGIGGSGKTRIAVKLAEILLQSYPDGVWFVDLSPLREASRVAEVIAATLAIGEEPGKSLFETVVHYASGKRLLLVLDNCEHLVDTCGTLVDALLRTADDVHVLVTSRESLGIAGERLFALRPLTVPPEARLDLDEVRSSEAVRLFVDRAQIVDREFVFDMQSAPQVVEICRRLDGIPLAIELAAARVKMLSVEEIRSRLDDRFRLLTGGHKTLPRHQTLRAAFQWSYDLLTQEEQRLFRLLAVFAGGWTLEAATAVWSDATDEFEVLELMTYLVDKSLVTIERVADGTTRYRMLETSRQFAQEKLDEASEGEGARARHLKYFVAWQGEREGTEDWADEGGRFKQVGQEYENLLLALETSARTEDGARHGLRLAHHMGGYWTRCGMYGIGRERTGAALQRPGAESPTPERAAALASMGHMAWKQDAQAEARTCYEESLALSRKYGNARGVIRALNGLGFVYFAENDPCAAQACFEEALALALARERRAIGVCLNGLALLAWERDDLAQARAHWEDALAALRGLENRWSLDCRAVVATNLNNVALRNNAWEEVRSNLREALPIVCSGLRGGAAIQVLEQLASLASVKGEAMRAARWFGAAAALERAFGSKLHFRKESFRFEERLREKMGAATFTRVAAEGAAVGYEEALAEAQAWLEDPQRRVHRS